MAKSTPNDTNVQIVNADPAGTENAAFANRCSGGYRRSLFPPARTGIRNHAAALTRIIE